MKTRIDEPCEEIRPITMPGVHSRFLKFFNERSEPEGLNILDVGAGGKLYISTPNILSMKSRFRVLFSPLMLLVRKIQGYSPIHNQKELLLGRLLFMVFSK